MQSLAEFLGTAPPKSDTINEVRAPEKMSGEEFASAVVNSREFHQYVLNGLILGELPPAVVMRLMDYAPGWGKPVEKLEVEHTGPQFESLSRDELIERIALMRAMLEELPDDTPTLH